MRADGCFLRARPGLALDCAEFRRFHRRKSGGPAARGTSWPDTAAGEKLRSLYPRAPDLRAPATQHLADGELFYIIENGVRLTGMPAWGVPGTAKGSWHLVHFIRHLPALTADEQGRMEALTPRSPDEWRALEEEDAFLRGEVPAPREPGHAHSH